MTSRQAPAVLPGDSLPTDSISLPLPSRIRNLAVNLRGGDDSLRIRFQSDTQITRDFSVVLGVRPE